MAEHGLRPGSSSLRDLTDIKPEGGSIWSGLAEAFGLSEGKWNPSNPTHERRLEAIFQRVRSGVVPDEHIITFAEQNPATIPLLEQAMRERDVLRKNLQSESPSLGSVAGEIAFQGDPERAAKYAGLVPKQGESPFAKINPKEYTQDSVLKFEQTQRYSDLKPSKEASLDPEKIFDHATKLRGEFRQLSSTFIDVGNSYGRIQESAKDPSAAGDLALIFNYMKMLDPQSVVREGEFATAQNSASIPNRVRAMYNKVVSGERLSTDTRDDFVKRSDMLFDRQSESHKKLTAEYSSLSKKLGVRPDYVIVDFTPDKVQKNKNPNAAIPSGWTVRQK